jgi:hypothetical protein
LKFEKALKVGEKWAVEQYINQTFGKNAELARAIFTAESGLTCSSEGDKHLKYLKDGKEFGASYGVAQIRHLPGRPEPKQLKDCKYNIDYAYRMFASQGNFSAWSAYKNKSYLRFYD